MTIPEDLSRDAEADYRAATYTVAATVGEVERLRAHVRHLLAYCHYAHEPYIKIVYCRECGVLTADGKHAAGCGVGAAEEAVK